MAANEQVQKYYDALIASYDILTDAVSRGNERGMKVTRQFVADVAQGQREALELGKKLAGEPTDIGQFYTSVLEATTAAQGRALTFTQTAYQEALGAGTEAREVIEKLVEANKETSQAAIAATRSFAAANPMADFVRRGYEAMQPKASATVESKKKAEKVAV